MKKTKEPHSIYLVGIKGMEQLRHLIARQHHGEAALGLGPANFAQPRQVDPQHLLVEKQQGRQGLLVRGGGHLSFVGQMRKKALDLCRAHLSWVPRAVEMDKRLDPIDVSLFGTPTVVKVAHTFAQLVQQAHGLDWRATRAHPSTSLNWRSG